MEVESIKRHFKSRLVGTVLNGYLCLRKLVVQRTKLIDETQDMLLEMLEDMTTGGWPPGPWGLPRCSGGWVGGGKRNLFCRDHGPCVLQKRCLSSVDM